MTRGRHIVWIVALVSGLAGVGYILEPEIRSLPMVLSSGIRTPVAVLGDSDSHGYRDRFDDKRRGGEFHGVTWNWTEIWHLLRSSEVNQGRFGVWGTSYRVARIRRWFGLPSQAPRKLDFEYNYAVSGLRCASLLHAWPYQGRWLLDRIDRERDKWQDGLVIIRIGVNDFGQEEHLMEWSRSGLNDKARSIMDGCVDAHEEMLHAIRSRTAARVVLVGIAHDYNVDNSHELWPRLEDILRIVEVLDYFDARLRRLAASDARTAFADDVTAYRSRLGDRTTEDLRFEFELNGEVFRRSRGDEPHHLTLADGHAGTVSNALWLNSLIDTINGDFGLQLRSLSEEEILSLIHREHSLSLSRSSD